MNGIVKGIINDKKLLWFSLKSDKVTLENLDVIFGEIDTEYSVDFIDKKQLSGSRIAQRFTHRYNDEIFALSIFHRDLIDFILFKETLAFGRVKTMMDKYFKFEKPEKRKGRRKS